MIRFRMLGTVDLREAQGREVRAVLRRPKLLALLGYLAAARPSGFHRRDILVSLLWPDLDTAHARNALRQAVHALREPLGNDVLVARGDEELGVTEQSLWCDVREFAAGLDAGDADRALNLYLGELLTGLHISDVPEFERWLDQEREHLRRRAAEAARLLTDCAEEAGNAGAAARWARRLTELSPFDETAVRRLVELLVQAGDRAGAVRAYEEFERRLDRDLEVQPSSETRRLVQSIRAGQEDDALGRAAPREPAVNTRSAAAAPEIQRTPSEPPRLPRSRALRSRPAAVLAMLLGAFLTGGWFLARTHATSADPGLGGRRVMVLPFANLGPAEDEYFADGVTEEITARLAAVGRLRVIAGTSGSVYKGTRKTDQEIGQEVGADYLLEGSVRWQKTPRGAPRLRVTPQLVSTRDGTHLWAQVYDEPLDEIFRIQSDIAHRVVDALDITLLEPQRRLVEAAPTGNLQAYDYYLRGNEYMRGGTEEHATRASQRMYEKAVALDPRFASAYARLSRVHLRMYLFHYDRSRDRLAQAKRAIDQAFKLGSDLPDAHHALGAYYWIGYSEYDGAFRELAVAEAARPNDPDLLLTKAAVWARQGNIREALASLEKAAALDPGSALIQSTYAQAYDRLRAFRRAEAAYDRAMVLEPDWAAPYHFKAEMYMRWEGRTAKARAVLEEARAVGVADQPFVFLDRVLVDLFDRKYGEALNRVASSAPRVIANQFRFLPRAELYAVIYGLMERHTLERASYDSARSLVLKKLQEQPDDPRLHSALGIAYAGLGRKQEAIEEAEKGVAILPDSKDTYRGYYRRWDAARVYAMVGEPDAAIDRLEYLLSIPGNLTAAWLRIDPTWDPLRNHPRFQKLLSKK